MHRYQAYSDFNINGWSGSIIKSEMIQEKIDTYFRRNTTIIQCPCEHSVSTGPFLVQCQGCDVWQHTRCVVISEDPEDVVPSVPPQFYCQVCRIRRADPFWVTMPSSDSCLFKAVKLISNVNWLCLPMLIMEREFQLGRSTCELLLRPDYEIQVWCVLLNDRVPFRMHWPVCANLRVNGLPFWPVDRRTERLRANDRHCGSIVKTAVHEGVNRISLTGSDARSFCWGLRIVKRRTVQEVLNLILEEPNGEHFEDALARVCRGSPINNAKDGEDNTDGEDNSDDDLEIVTAFVDLRCPLSGSIMKIAGRFRPCTHMGCFDLRTCVEISEYFDKWQCPICLKTYSFEDIIVDPYFNRVVAKMDRYGDNGTRIEVKPDGSWRAKDHDQWHLPDSTPIIPEKDLILSLGSLNPSKQSDNFSNLVSISTIVCAMIED